MRKFLLTSAVALWPAFAFAQVVVGSLSPALLNQPNGVLQLDGTSKAPIANLPTGPGSTQVALGSTVAAITASATISAAGSTQSAATPISAATTYVTATAANQGVILVSSIPNGRIVNTSTYSILVYPPSGGTINGAATNAAVLIYPGGSAQAANTSGASWSAG